MIFWRQWLGSKSVYGYWSAATATRLLGVKDASQTGRIIFVSHHFVFSSSLIDTPVASIGVRGWNS
jgi:hypothetical protein